MSTTRTNASFPWESVRSKSSPKMKWTGCCFPSLIEMLDAYKYVLSSAVPNRV